MKPDIAIHEIREVRHQMTAECGHDLDRFFAMLEAEERGSRRKSAASVKSSGSINRRPFRKRTNRRGQWRSAISPNPEPTMRHRLIPNLEAEGITTDHIIE